MTALVTEQATTKPTNPPPAEVRGRQGPKKGDPALRCLGWTPRRNPSIPSPFGSLARFASAASRAQGFINHARASWRSTEMKVRQRNACH